ncbi:MAG: LytTR family transcriptional regulator [Clostridiales bacterium]|nr:LytTR family transcriptional regulator [Clostridiales bacterium]
MGKIILYDPGKKCAELAESLPVREIDNSRVFHTFTAEDQLIFYLEEINEDVDILIVNLVRQEEKGAGVARTCKKRIHHLKLVLVVDRLDLSEHLFELQPDFLLFSPLDKNKLKQVILYLEQLVEQEYKRCLTLVTKGKIYRIPYQKILHVESSGHQLCIKTWEEEIWSYGKLDELLERLPSYFLHCHKSYLVNLNYVRQLEMYRLRLQGEEEWIPVSQKYYRNVRLLLTKSEEIFFT